MSQLIDPAVLYSPEVRAAFPPTARRMILRPIIDYINMLSNNATTQSFSDSSYAQNISTITASLQQQIDALKTRVTGLENALAVPAADAIADLSANSPVSISLGNLANIGLLANNENEDRKTINRITALLRSHGWIKP